ncbi:hypothetical protein OS31_31610 [Dickeya oryzae]
MRSKAVAGLITEDEMQSEGSRKKYIIYFISQGLTYDEFLINFIFLLNLCRDFIFHSRCFFVIREGVNGY